MHIADELARLGQAIELCRKAIAEHEQSLSRLEGRPGGPEVERRVELYRDLLARQLARREELLKA